MKIKAAVIHEMGRKQPYAESRPMAVEELELDPPGPGEVLVRMGAAGLCHSDLSTVNGDRPRPLPMVLGHEAAGIVEGLGDGVSDLEKGDHVVMVFVPSCGHCMPCAEGRPALCEPGFAANSTGMLLGGKRRLSRAAAPVYHHVGVSAFATHAVVSRRSLVKVDKELPLTEAALFGCAVLTGVGAVVNTAKVQPGATVAVLGLGGVGLNGVLGALLVGASRVIAVDLLPEKLALARQLGATDAVNAGDADAAEQVRALTKGGVDYAFELAGSAKAMELAYKMTRRGGMTVTASLPHPTHTFSIPHTQLVAEERSVRGSYVGSSVPSRDIPRFIDLYRRGKLPVDRLLSEQLKLEEINLGFDRLAAGKTVRQMIVFN
ncbi:MAG: zinc-dependent alcohol dehydrogenase family protein [Alphaproteobacteria bacterium]|nr:zinc-dependent alcohol dehydrogenase family protein [Alphaproteobacteria bacterium]